MEVPVVLLADNDFDYLILAKEFLEKQGFNVVIVSTPAKAKKVMTTQHIDVAVIDVRLLNDHDSLDITGIHLAEEIGWGRFIPRIMISIAPSLDNIREALREKPGNGVIASNFVAKQEGHWALLKAIEEVLSLNTSWIRRQIVKHFNISELKDLCFDLDIEFENLDGNGRADKARELVAYFERRGHLMVLVAYCRKHRPNMF